MSDATPSPTVEEALHTTVDLPFEDAVPHVQLEHEIAGFETVSVTRLDHFIEAVLGEAIPKTALIVVCHAEIAREALDIDPQLAGLLPCTTVVYEDERGDTAGVDDGERARADTVNVYHASTTKAIRDLGCASPECRPEIEALVEMTSEVMTDVWENIGAYA